MQLFHSGLIAWHKSSSFSWMATPLTVSIPPLRPKRPPRPPRPACRYIRSYKEVPFVSVTRRRAGLWLLCPISRRRTESRFKHKAGLYVHDQSASNGSQTAGQGLDQHKGGRYPWRRRSTVRDPVLVVGPGEDVVSIQVWVGDHTLLVMLDTGARPSVIDRYTLQNLGLDKQMKEDSSFWTMWSLGRSNRFCRCGGVCWYSRTSIAMLAGLSSDNWVFILGHEFMRKFGAIAIFRRAESSWVTLENRFKT